VTDVVDGIAKNGPNVGVGGNTTRYLQGTERAINPADSSILGRISKNFESISAKE
jgi:hypothetical protein